VQPNRRQITVGDNLVEMTGEIIGGDASNFRGVRIAVDIAYRNLCNMSRRNLQNTIKFVQYTQWVCYLQEKAVIQHPFNNRDRASPKISGCPIVVAIS